MIESKKSYLLENTKLLIIAIKKTNSKMRYHVLENNAIMATETIATIAKLTIVNSKNFFA